MLNTESRKRFLNVAMWIGLLKAALLRIQHLSNAQGTGIEDVLALESPTHDQLQAPLSHFTIAAGGIMSLSSKEMSALVVGCLVTQLQVDTSFCLALALTRLCSMMKWVATTNYDGSWNSS
ncbi:TPA: hypothetical protein ACH3X1_015178 [Trebouxia sp. C0004]